MHICCQMIYLSGHFVLPFVRGEASRLNFESDISNNCVYIYILVSEHNKGHILTLICYQTCMDDECVEFDHLILKN